MRGAAPSLPPSWTAEPGRGTKEPLSLFNRGMSSEDGRMRGTFGEALKGGQDRLKVRGKAKVPRIGEEGCPAEEGEERHAF